MSSEQAIVEHVFGATYCARVHTFDARLSRAGFWAAMIVPPLAFLLVVQGWANSLQRGELSIRSTLWVMALAQGLPLGALLWTIFSTAAYSIGEGKLVVHSVLADREFSLAKLSGIPQLRDGVITLHVPRRIRVRVADPHACWAVLLKALPATSA